MKVNNGYQSLAGVLHRALDQAQSGKGAERHADGEPFDHQPMQRLCELYGVGFALGQAAKKSQEAQRMSRDAAVRELLGAINYLAGAVIHLERPLPGEDVLIDESGNVVGRRQRQPYDSHANDNAHVACKECGRGLGEHHKPGCSKKPCEDCGAMAGGPHACGKDGVHG